MNETQTQFISELYELLNKYNARIDATTIGYGDYKVSGLSVTMYEDKPVIGSNNKISDRMEISGSICCHDSIITNKLK